jgi:hypothetical protein
MKDALDYDNLESFMAGQLGWIARQYREEVQLKQDLCEYFKVDIKFEYEYKDMQIVMPEKVLEMHPVFSFLNKYDWVNVSNNVDGIVFYSDKILMPDLRQPMPDNTEGEKETRWVLSL